MCRLTTKKVWLPDRHTDRRTHIQTDAGQSDPYVPLCFAGDTKMMGVIHSVITETGSASVNNALTWLLPINWNVQNIWRVFVSMNVFFHIYQLLRKSLKVNSYVQLFPVNCAIYKCRTPKIYTHYYMYTKFNENLFGYTMCMQNTV